jgi:membrane protease YdiL (CAAX protease family)
LKQDKTEALVAKVQMSGSEKRALVLWVLAGLVGMWYAHRNFFNAFPEASLNFKVTREEALTRARTFVESLGQNLKGYRSVIVFGVDDNAKTYLERQVGLKEANQMMTSEVNVWHWDVRFFKPQQEEEFRVGVSPEGNLSGYEHIVPEARAGGDLSRETAKKTAQDFLKAKLGKSAGDWDFLPEESNSVKRPNRTDWTFTWEKHGFRAKDAPERLQIGLNGGEVGGAKEALKVPEQWERDYKHLRSTNEFYNTVAIIPYLLLFGAALGIGIQLTRKGQTNWRLAWQLGLLVAILLAAMQLNRWPLDLSGYNTNNAYGSFVIDRVMWALLFGIFSALTVSLVLPGGEPLYRAAKPELLRLRNTFTWRGVRTKEFFSSTIVGVSLAAAHMGFLVAFYLIANHFGAWAPQEVKYDDSLNTSIPWIGGLAIGLLAATSEEFLFRLFAIPYLLKLTKSRIVAVLLPAFAWGFLHTAYPNEPPYIRGLEVGLIGVVAGIVMLRWGILATLIWHYTVDACIVGLYLIRSSSSYLQVFGVVIGLAVLIPFGAAVYWRIRRGTFEEDTDLLNAAPDAAEEQTEVEVRRDATVAPTGPLANGMLGFLAVTMVLGGLAAWKLKPVHLGDYLKLPVNAAEAKVRARGILEQRGVDAKDYRTATVFVDVTDAAASEYLREKIGIPALNEIYAKRVPGALWHVRFFREGQPEEYSVILKPDGTLHSVHHGLAEAAPGATLSKDEAVSKAQEFLRAEKRFNLSNWTLVEATSEKKPHRLDHKLIWQENQALDAPQSSPPTPEAADSANHAFARVQLAVEGDEVSSYRTFIKIPDEWRRKNEEQSVARTVLTYFPLLFVFAAFGSALVFFLREIKSELMKAVPWKRFAGWALVGLLAYVLVAVFGGRIPQALSTYQTAMPLKFMFGALGIGFLVGAFFYLGALVLVFAIGWFFLREAFGNAEFPRWRGMPGNYYRDALMIGLGGTAGLILVRRVTEWTSTHWPTERQFLGAAFGNDFDSYIPGISIAATAVLRGLLYTGAIGVAAGFIASRCKSPVLRGALFVLASLAMAGGWGSPADFMKQWLAGAIFLAVVVFGVTRVIRLNLLGSFLVITIPMLLLGGLELISQPNGFYRQQGLVCFAALGILLLWPAVNWLTAKGSASPQTAQ